MVDFPKVVSGIIIIFELRWSAHS